MLTLTTVVEARAHLDRARRQGLTVGLVPTMGFLHRGHVSLMKRARAECDVVVTTIFVNPLQFGSGEDLDAYPRDLAGDAALAESSGVDLLFVPTKAAMFGGSMLTTVSVAELTTHFEGASRPTHFAGVTTIVAKLANIAGECRAYFGEKDWQQLVVVTRMVRDLSFPVAVVGCPTVREPDGLALSSRNAYLGDAERAAAPVIHRALRAAADAVENGQRDPVAVQAIMESLIAGEPLADLDYAAVVNASSLEPVDPLRGEVRLLAAARFGPARLIDNVGAVAR